MTILSNKLWIWLIVLVVLGALIVIGTYLGIRWASQDQAAFNGGRDQLTAALEQKEVELEAWSQDFLNEFPDVPAVKATIESYREILSQVIAQNEQLRQEGVPMKKRVKKLTQFGKEILPSIAQRTRSTELHLELMREDTALKEQIDRYMHADWMLPLPISLLGLNKKEMRALQEQLQGSQKGHQ